MELDVKSKEEIGEQYECLLLDQWKTCVEMANSNSEKRISTNNVYITINAAIFAVISFTMDYKSILLSIVGSFVCVLWTLSIRSYRRLSKEKYEIINLMERKLPTQPFAYEWSNLKKDKKHKQLTHLETLLPWLFIGLYVISIIWPVVRFVLK